MRGGQVGQHQFTEPVGFFQMRIAGEYEGIDAQAAIFVYALLHRFRVTDQRRTRPATDQADARPQVGTDLQPVAPAAMQRAHARLAHRIHAGENLLGLCNRGVIQMLDQTVRVMPCLFLRFAHDHMQADAE